MRISLKQLQPFDVRDGAAHDKQGRAATG